MELWNLMQRRNKEKMENENKIVMGVYDKETKELKDSGQYDTEEEAKEDFEKWDKPRGRYALLDDGTRWD